MVDVMDGYAQVERDLKTFIEQHVNALNPELATRRRDSALEHIHAILKDRNAGLTGDFNETVPTPNAAQDIKAMAAIFEVTEQFRKPMDVKAFVANCNNVLPPVEQDNLSRHTNLRGILRDLPDTVMRRDADEMQAMLGELQWLSRTNEDVRSERSIKAGRESLPASLDIRQPA